MKNVLVILLSHQPVDQLSQTLTFWEGVAPRDSILLAYGGSESVFPQINFEQKAFIHDPRLRLRDQQREFQSWAGVLEAARKLVTAQTRFDYVYLVEYDQIPLVGDLLQRLIVRTQEEHADILAHHLHRIDGTSNAHYLYHLKNRWFHDFFARMSKRSDKSIILSMLGTGSFWRREAFEQVSAQAEPFPIYLELYLPTLAHHLGFRLRDMPDQNSFVMHLGDRSREIEMARERGAWTLHPVKTLSTAIKLA